MFLSLTANPGTIFLDLRRENYCQSTSFFHFTFFWAKGSHYSSTRLAHLFLMDAVMIPAADLRNKQKPLKDRYCAYPGSALVTLSSRGSLESTGLTCSLSSAGAAHRVVCLHQAAGGQGVDASGEPCSGDMLLESLVACFGVTIRAVATSMGISVANGTITAEGDLDFRGTLGVKTPAATPCRRLPGLGLSVGLEVPDEQKDKAVRLIELSERYCVVLRRVSRNQPSSLRQPLQLRSCSTEVLAEEWPY